MIAIFNNKNDADEYSAAVHAHLIENRPGYNAVRWSNTNKHDKINEFGVKLPPDLDKLKKPMNPNAIAKSIRQDEKYANDWEAEVADLHDDKNDT